MKKYLSILILLHFFCVIASGQGVPAGIGTQAVKKQVKTIGRINHDPSPAREILLNGETIANAIVLSGSLPINASGTTMGYSNDYDEECEFASIAPDLVYSYSPASNITVDFDLCGSDYDTKIFIYENSYTPGSPFACNDDFYEDDICGTFTSLISGADLIGGSTYFIVIDGYDEESYGEFVLEIRPTPPCEYGVQLNCPEGAASENEVCGIDINGGCNMQSNPNWEDVPASGGAFCGTTYANANFRDTDWYELVLTQASIVSLAANAEVTIRYGLAYGGNGGYGGNPDCDYITGMLPFAFAGPCLETSLDLGVLNPGTYWFVVRMDVYNGFPCDNYYWINFQVTPVPCVPPTALTATDITPTSATLAWTQGGTETSWEYAYGIYPLPVPAGSGIATSTSSNPVTGLTPDVLYQFYARSVCGGGEFSPWTGPFDFTTPQIAATLPFTENFESWPDNWKVVNGTQTNKWAVGAATEHTGASSAYISNNGGAANIYTVVNTSTVHMYRDITFTDGPGGYILKFWWKGTGEACCDFMKVFLLSTSTTLVAGITPTTGQIGVNYNSQSNWVEVTINLPGSLTGQTRRLVFSWINDGSEGMQPPVAIDDISLVAFVCQPPTALTAINITKTTADIGWTNGDQETAWEYYFGESPLAPPGGAGTPTTVNPAHLVGLSESTEYQFYVRANCGTIFSSWAGPHTFATVCGDFPVPYNQQFDGVTAPAIPLCWTVTDNNSDGVGWATSSSAPKTSPNSMKIGSNSALAMNDWFFTPSMTLDPGTYLLTFWYRGSGPADPEKLEVMWGTGPASALMTGGLIFNNNNIINDSYMEGAGTLTVLSQGNYFIGWHGYSDPDGSYLYVDDILIQTNIFTWTGSISSDWNNAGNWSSATVPNQFVVVEIPSSPSGGRFPAVGSGTTANCFKIDLGTGASVTVQGNGILNVLNP